MSNVHNSDNQERIHAENLIYVPTTAFNWKRETFKKQPNLIIGYF